MRWAWAAAILAASCKEARIVEKAVISRVEPQMQATVITIQTTLQPQDKTFLHAIVIGNGRARTSDEADRCPRFELRRKRVR